MQSKRGEDVGKMRRVHPHAWLWESLEAEPSIVVRPMFGTRAVYLDGKLALCFSAQAEPWRGVLLCTDHIHHRSLMTEFPVLKPHPILPKWLYLPESADAFESVAERLVRCVRLRDVRIGVHPKPRKPVAKSAVLLVLERKNARGDPGRLRVRRSRSLEAIGRIEPESKLMHGWG